MGTFSRMFSKLLRRLRHLFKLHRKFARSVQQPAQTYSETCSKVFREPFSSVQKPHKYSMPLLELFRDLPRNVERNLFKNVGESLKKSWETFEKWSRTFTEAFRDLLRSVQITSQKCSIFVTYPSTSETDNINNRWSTCLLRKYEATLQKSNPIDRHVTYGNNW